MNPTQGMIAGAILALALFVYTFWPENAFAAQMGKSRLDYLLERRDQLTENLRDLHFEYQAGKYSQAEYDQMRRQLESEAVQLQNEIHLLERA